MPIYDKEKEKEYAPGSHDNLGMSDDERAAEIDRLENDFSAPAFSGADNKELGALDKAKGGLFNPSDKAQDNKSLVKNLGNKLLGSRRKKIIAGGGLAGLGVGGLMLGLLTGPFHAIHLAQILMKDNFGNEKASNLRINALYRYARTGDFGETRLSYLSSKKFRSTQVDLAKIGVTFDASKTFGNARTINIEIDKHPATRGLPPDQAKAQLLREFSKAGITEADIHASGNKFTIDSRRIGVSATRAIAKNSISHLDGGKISGWIKMRAFAKFYNLPSMFHPLKKIDRNVQDNIEIKGTKEERKKLEEERQKKIKDAYRSQVASLGEKLKSKTSGVKAGLGSALLITGTVCMARSAADDAIEYNRAAIVGPAVIKSMDKIAVGSQTQSNIDISVEQLGGVVDSFYDEEGRSIWEAKALSEKTNPEDPKGEDIEPGYAQAFAGGGAASNLKNLGDDYGADKACSPLGQIIQLFAGAGLLLASIPTGGGSTAVYTGLRTVASVGVGFAVMHFLQEGLTEMLKNDGIPDDLSAPQKGNVLAYGSREMANVDARASGGIELSAEESAALDREEQVASQTEFAERPLLARMFDTQDYRSMASRVINNQSPSPGDNLENMASGLAKLPFSLGNAFASLFPKLQAAGQPYDYGFNRYGIPQEILDDPEYDDPYENSRIVAEMLDESNDESEEYIERANACFGVNIKKLGDGWGVIPDHEVNPNTSEYEDADCSNIDDGMWPRIMLFIRDTREMEAAACYEGDQDACLNNSGESDSDAALKGQFTAMSFNVLGANHTYGSPIDWETNRRTLVLNTVLDKSPDIAGFQEVNRMHQYDDLKAGLSEYSTWSGGTDELEGGFARPLFWKNSRFERIDAGHYRYQRYPDDPPGVSPWVKLKDRDNGSVIYVFNYHGVAKGRNFDEKKEGARDLVKEVSRVAGDESPVVIVGDFNTTYGQEPHKIITSAGFEDTNEIAETRINNEYKTHHPDPPEPREKGDRHIDHIFLRADDIPVPVWENVINENSIIASDHTPIMATIGTKDAEQEQAESLPMGRICNINDGSLGESSGLAASQKHTEVVYTHNDEKGPIYAIDSATCRVVGKINVNGQRADPDPEAIQVDHTTGNIWLGDIGNGHPGQPKSMTTKDPTLKHPSTPARIIVFSEPNDLNATISNAQTYDITYQGGMQNSEALLVNPKTGEGYIISKGAQSRVFKLPHPIRSGQATDTGVRIPQWVTDATFTNDGKWALIRYATATNSGPTSVLVYDAKTWQQAGTITVPKVEKGESITVEKSTPSFLIGSEGENSPLIRVALPPEFGGSSSTGSLSLKNWKITLPECDGGDAKEIKQPELDKYVAAGGSQWFKKTAAGLDFYVNSSGACTTGGSSNPRSELREMNADGSDEYEWNPSSGTHRMIIRQKVAELAVRGDSAGVVIGQIHDVDKGIDDYTVFRLEGKTLYALIDGKKSASKIIDSNFPIGKEVTMGFGVENGTVNFLYDPGGGSQPKTVHSIKYPSGSKGAYFKAGNYCQCGKDGRSGSTRVIISSLEVTHK